MARPRGTTGKAQVLTEPEFKRVISVIKGHYNEKHGLRNTAIMYVSFYLALRVSEIAYLTISHVANADGSIKPYLRLTADMTKGNKHRDVYISHPALIKALTQHIAYLQAELGERFKLDLPLFSSQKGGAFSGKTLGKLIKDIFDLAGFQDASSHSGRRSMITNLIHAGYDIKSVSLIAGHSSIATTSIYVESSPEKLSHIMSKVFN